jgi:hypothetical protein
VIGESTRAWTHDGTWDGATLVALRLWTVTSRLGVCVIADASGRCQGHRP